MRKLLFFLGLLAGLPRLAAAQTDDAPANTLLGLKAGASRTTFTGADADGQHPKTGLHFGVLVNAKLGRVVSLQPEVLYAQKGARLVDGRAESFNRFSYLDVPLLVRLSRHGAFVEAGPQYSLLMSAKNKAGDVVKNVTDSFYSADWGYVAGLGYQLPNGLGLELRYSAGLRSTARPYVNARNQTVRPELRNSGFQLALFYLISGPY
jgi:hypothetical protein